MKRAAVPVFGTKRGARQMAQTTSYERTPNGAQSGPQALDLRGTFERIRAAARTLPTPSHQERMDGLARLGDSILRRQEEMVAAVRADFGNRSEYETKISEVLMVLD